MSATLNYEQALKYTRGSADEPSLIFVMQMGMVSVFVFIFVCAHCSECPPILIVKSILTPPQMFTIHS